MDFLPEGFTVLSSDGQGARAGDVENYDNNDDVKQFVDSLRTKLVFPLHACEEKTPSDSTESPRTGTEDSIESLHILNTPLITRTLQQKLCDHFFEWDDYCCIVTEVQTARQWCLRHRILLSQSAENCRTPLTYPLEETLATVNWN